MQRYNPGDDYDDDDSFDEEVGFANDSAAPQAASADTELGDENFAIEVGDYEVLIIDRNSNNGDVVCTLELSGDADFDNGVVIPRAQIIVQALSDNPLDAVVDVDCSDEEEDEYDDDDSGDDWSDEEDEESPVDEDDSDLDYEGQLTGFTGDEE